MSGIGFLAVQWRRFPHRASAVGVFDVFLITFSVNILSSCVLIPDISFFNKKTSFKGTSVWVLDMELMNSQTYEQNHFVDLNLIFRQHPIRTIFKLLKQHLYNYSHRKIMDLKSKPKLYPMYIQYETRLYISKYYMLGFMLGLWGSFLRNLKKWMKRATRLQKFLWIKESNRSWLSNIIGLYRR